MEPENTRCIQPWTHFYFDPVGKILPCFAAQGEFEHIKDFTSIEQALNSERFKQLRLDMLAGKKPSCCSVCYNREKHGLKSVRKSDLDDPSLASIFAATNPDGSIDDITLKTMNLGFNNICNFKCRICHNELSSSIEQEDLAIGFIKTPIVKNYDYETFDQLFEDLKDKATRVGYIHFFGGEPLVIQKQYDLVEHLITSGTTNMTLKYHTNLSLLKFKGKSIIEYWNKFPDVIACISVDGLGKKGEYVRHGFNYDTIIRNIEQIKRDAPHVKMNIDTTVSVYNALHVTELHRDLLERGLFDCTKLDLHDAVGEYSDARMLPASLKQQIRSSFDEFIQYIQKYPDWQVLANKYDSIFNYINSEDNSHFIPTFLKKLDRVDEYRKQSLFEVFPELNLLNDYRGM